MAIPTRISENSSLSSKPSSSSKSERLAVGRKNRSVVEGRSLRLGAPFRIPTKSKYVVLRYRMNSDTQILSFGAVRIFDELRPAQRFARDRNNRSKKFRYEVRPVPYVPKENERVAGLGNQAITSTR